MSKPWIAYDDENETVFCRGEDLLDTTFQPYEIANKLNQLEAEIAALKQQIDKIGELHNKAMAENAALKRGIAKHAEYDWEGNPINWCAALLKEPE